MGTLGVIVMAVLTTAGGYGDCGFLANVNIVETPPDRTYTPGQTIHLNLRGFSTRLDIDGNRQIPPGSSRIDVRLDGRGGRKIGSLPSGSTNYYNWPIHLPRDVVAGQHILVVQQFDAQGNMLDGQPARTGIYANEPPPNAEPEPAPLDDPCESVEPNPDPEAEAVPPDPRAGLPTTGPIHHLMTDKNERDGSRGGPWTPIFAEFLNGAGWLKPDGKPNFDHPKNKVRVPDHVGRHPEAYHVELEARIRAALGDALPGTPEYADRLAAALDAAARDAATPGTRMNQQLTNRNWDPTAPPCAPPASGARYSGTVYTS